MTRKNNKQQRRILRYMGYTGLTLIVGFPFYFIALFLLGMLGLGQ